MEKLEQKLHELVSLIKAVAPLMPTIQAPQAPKAPGMTAQNKKSPLKVAQQIKDKPTKKIAVKQAKEVLNVSKNGQWSLDAANPFGK